MLRDRAGGEAGLEVEVRWVRVSEFVLYGWVFGGDVFYSRERHSNEVDLIMASSLR